MKELYVDAIARVKDASDAASQRKKGFTCRFVSWVVLLVMFAHWVLLGALIASIPRVDGSFNSFLDVQAGFKSLVGDLDRDTANSESSAPVMLRGSGFSVASSSSYHLRAAGGTSVDLENGAVRAFLAELKGFQRSCPDRTLAAVAAARAQDVHGLWTNLLRKCLDINRGHPLLLPQHQFSLPSWPLSWDFPGLKALDARRGLFEVEAFLTHAEISDLLPLFDEEPGGASKLGAQPEGQDGCAVRHSSTSWVQNPPRGLQHRMQKLLGDVGEASRHEQLSITRYDPGGFYSDHFDNLGPSAEGNERAVTILMYLSDDDEAGGATYFTDLGIRVTPQRGKALVFFTTLPGRNEQNKWVRHCAEDTTGRKWVAQQWIRQQPLVSTEKPRSVAAAPVKIADVVPPETLASTPSTLVHSSFRGRRKLGKPKSRIIFHHMWKCGGANFCDMALRNGEYAPNPNDPNPSHRCDADSFDEDAFLRSNYSFVAWQAPWPLSYSFRSQLSQFALITLLRNPLNQVLSHYSHCMRYFGLWSNFSEFMAYGLCVSENSAFEDSLDRCQSHLLKMSFDALHPFALFRDNLQTRWLVAADGPAGLEVGKRPNLTSFDLTEAKARLDGFDEVLILEDLHDRDRWRLKRFGWTDVDDRITANIHRPKSSWDPSDASKTFSKQPDVVSHLRIVQRWDLELYAYGRELARLQAERYAQSKQA